MYVNSYEVTVKTAGGATLVFDDSVDAGAGASAYGAVDNGQDIKANISGVLNIVPFGSIDYVTVEVTRSSETDPEDETCVTEEAESPADPETPEEPADPETPEEPGE